MSVLDLKTCRPELAFPFLAVMIWFACLDVCNSTLGQVTRPQQSNKSDKVLREAIQRAIAPIERAMVGYRENRRCFSCHHHAHAVIGLSTMVRRGLDVDRELLQIQYLRSISRTRMVENRYLENQGIGGGVDTAGHALLVMRIGNHRPDKTTDAMIAWLLKQNQNQGFWTGTKNRAPTQTSDVTRTWLCLDALKHFGPLSLTDEIEEQETRSRKWLLDVDVASTEDKVSRIRALSVIGDASDLVNKFAAALVKEQRDDGGWAQTDEMDSDAYATGSVLMTLHQNAGLSTDHACYQRGIAFLESTQLDDGTWHVATRATRVQKYFESGFPHGRDQFISFTATCWAATAMALSLPESNWQNQHPAALVDLSSPSVELDAEVHHEFQERFDREIWPIISDNGKSSCIRCHDQNHQSGFRLTGEASADFTAMLGDGWFHPHDPGGILFCITSKNPEFMMPPGKLPRLEEAQVEVLTEFARDLYQFPD